MNIKLRQQQIRYYLSFFLLLFFGQSSFATHIVGGEMNYRCLGNDQYEIKLTVFRDCDTGIPDFDNPASIGIFAYDVITDSYFLDTMVGQFGQLLIPKMNDDTLNPFLNDLCLVVPPNVCVNTSTYTDTVSLPFRVGGYTLAYERCCRNESILNIETPLDVGGTYTAVISETALTECNSNAVFNEWPPIYVCVNEPIIFDHSATDIDGDSIVYRLCVPYQGASPAFPIPQPPAAPPYAEVVWVDPPYNLNNIMGGIPLAIDSETGLLTATPNTIGQFVVGICAEEYRNGELISTTRRDFQYNVGVCGDFISSFFVPEVSCEGLEVTFDNQSLNAQTYEWSFNDPGNPGATSPELEPTFIYSDTGTYTAVLAIQAVIDTFVCEDTSLVTFSIYEDSLFPDFEFEVTGCEDPIIVDLTDISQDTIWGLVNWEWSVDGTPFAVGQNPPTYDATNNTNGQLGVELVITNERGCKDSMTQLVDLSQGITLDFINALTTCEILQETTLLVENVNNANITGWSWEPSAGIISGGDTNSPTVDLSVADTYYFTVEYDSVCIYEDSIMVMNNGVDLMLSATATPDTIEMGETSQLNVTGNNLFTFDWLPPETLDDPTRGDPVASPDTTTEYTSTVTDVNGCVDTISVLVVVINQICDEPFLFMPNAFTPNGDSENDILYVEGNTVDEMYLVIYDRWGEKVFETRDQNQGWDGMYNGELLEPDVYGFYLTINCFKGEVYSKKGNINLIR
ncbi:MAG: T9SS type B sorting domain-containing protein [Bacteroidota bacterium]